MQGQFSKSSILLVDDIEQKLEELQDTLEKNSFRIIKNEESANKKSEFLISSARLAVKEAYLSTATTKYIIIYGYSFRVEAQNALLKVLEEPPKNIIFLILANSKSSLLPTIFSRLEYKYLKKQRLIKDFELDLRTFSLKDLYAYLKSKERIAQAEAKEELGSIMQEVTRKNIVLKSQELELFSTSMKLINLNSKPINVLGNLLLHILQNKKRV